MRIHYDGTSFNQLINNDPDMQMDYGNGRNKMQLGENSLKWKKWKSSSHSLTKMSNELWLKITFKLMYLAQHTTLHSALGKLYILHRRPNTS